jgi:hypothetical protein
MRWGVLSFGDFSLHEQRKVTRSPAERAEALALRKTKPRARTKAMDSGFRRNDQQDGFRLSPE